MPPRKARLAVSALFFSNGALFANLLPRYPEIKHDLGLSNAAFGAAVAAYPLGALAAGLSAGMLVRRFGSPRVAVGATFLAGLGFVAAGAAPAGTVLAAGLFLAGAMDSITDVAQNLQGLRVQRLYGRSVLNSFHGIWSLGAVVGGAMGAALAALGVPTTVHMIISALICGGLSASAYRFLLPGPEPVAEHAVSGERSRWTLPRIGILLALVVIGAAGAVGEDSGSSWGAIYLSGSLGAGTFVAGLGFVALQSLQVVGRLSGDQLVDRFGQRRTARAGGVVVTLGMGAALLVPTVPGTIVGFGLTGLGVATLIPAAVHGADQVPGLRPGVGLTMVSWLLRVGFLAAPPIVGAIADATSLRIGLLVVPIAGVLVIGTAGVLSG